MPITPGNLQYLLQIIVFYNALFCIPNAICVEYIISNSVMGRASGTLEMSADSGDLGRRVKRSADDTIQGFTNEQRIAILSLHNENRRGTTPPAANMRYMVWNVEIEEQAQTHADTCDSFHGNDNPIAGFSWIGQNIFGVSNPAPTPESIVNSWMNEANNYNYSAGECMQGQCGHYTQVVWDFTQAVGCGIRECPDGIVGFQAGFVVVCNYGEGGNLPRTPYTEGTPCDSCPNAFPACEDALCRPEPPCGDTACENGGALRTDCLCDCPSGTDGALCQVASDTTTEAPTTSPEVEGDSTTTGDEESLTTASDDEAEGDSTTVVDEESLTTASDDEVEDDSTTAGDEESLTTASDDEAEGDSTAAVDDESLTTASDEEVEDDSTAVPDDASLTTASDDGVTGGPTLTNGTGQTGCHSQLLYHDNGDSFLVFNCSNLNNGGSQQFTDLTPIFVVAWTSLLGFIP